MDYVSLLKSDLAKADRGKKVTSIHLFGAKHHKELSKFTMLELGQLIRDAGEKSSLSIELRKGVRMGPHVTVK
jgi:hypothetical protein